jgi:hypothetical protein
MYSFYTDFMLIFMTLLTDLCKLPNVVTSPLPFVYSSSICNKIADLKAHVFQNIPHQIKIEATSQEITMQAFLCNIMNIHATKEGIFMQRKAYSCNKISFFQHKQYPCNKKHICSLHNVGKCRKCLSHPIPENSHDS